MKPLRFPALRPNIIAALTSLADPALQKQVWVGRGIPEPGKCASFDDVVHSLYDDTNVGDDLEGSIGEVLYDSEEAESLRRITSRIDLMFDKYGGRLADKEYLNKPEWPEIIDSAVKCLVLFKDNDRRCGKSIVD